MPLVETESIILKTYNLADADKIVLFLSRDHGVVRGVAKGVKRLKSRFGSGLEPFSVVALSYFEKEVLELVSIQKADLIASYFEAASDPQFFQKFAYLSDLLILFSPPNDPNEVLYRMVRACLDAGVEDRNSLSAIGLYFEIWLLRISGLMPDWSKCSECERTFSENEPASLQSNHHLICRQCRRSSGGVNVEAKHRVFLDAARRMSPREFSEYVSEYTDHVRELSLVMKRIASLHAGRDINEGRSFAVNQ
jgi:DNA repair protein RecO (recombination protein O)